MKQPRIVIVAAGTGGHVMPGLAVAQNLVARGWQVDWLGTQTGMEGKLVHAQGIPFHALAFSNMRGKGLVAKVTGFARLIGATIKSYTLLRRLSADAVFTTGGYVAVPVGLAAAFRRLPLFFLNADATPQLSLRLLRQFVNTGFCGFQGAASQSLGATAVVSGAPVRAALLDTPEPDSRLAGREGNLHILVAGGSLGARVLNDIVPQALALLPASGRPTVFHQCGAGHVEATRASYAQLGVLAEVQAFVDDMSAQYQQADLVICRAGAITVTELCAVGVASVLVPLLASTTTHQADNAQLLAQHQACIHLPQSALSATSLAALLASLNREKLLGMARAARALARPDATRLIADHIVSQVTGASPMKGTT